MLEGGDGSGEKCSHLVNWKTYRWSHLGRTCLLGCVSSECRGGVEARVVASVSDAHGKEIIRCCHYLASRFLKWAGLATRSGGQVGCGGSMASAGRTGA